MLGGRCGSPAMSAPPVAERSRARPPSCSSRWPRPRSPARARRRPICSAIGEAVARVRLAGGEHHRVAWPGSRGRAWPPARRRGRGPSRRAAARAPSWSRGRRRGASPPSASRRAPRARSRSAAAGTRPAGGRGLGGGVDPGAVGGEPVGDDGSRPADLAHGRPAQAEGAHEAIHRQALGARRTRRPARRRARGRCGAARAGPGRGRSPARTRGPRCERARMCGTPQRSRLISTGPSRPLNRRAGPPSAAAGRLKSCQRSPAATAAPTGPRSPAVTRPALLKTLLPRAIVPVDYLRRRRSARSPPAAGPRLELLQVGLHRHRGGRAHRRRDVVPAGVEQALRDRARPPRAPRPACARARRRCATYSAIFAAGSVIHGPCPGHRSAGLAAPRSARQRGHVVGQRAAALPRGGTIDEPWPRMRSPQKRRAVGSRGSDTIRACRGWEEATPVPASVLSDRPVQLAGASRGRSTATRVRRPQRSGSAALQIPVVGVRVGEQDAARSRPAPRRPRGPPRCASRSRAPGRSRRRDPAPTR